MLKSIILISTLMVLIGVSHDTLINSAQTPNFKCLFEKSDNVYCDVNDNCVCFNELHQNNITGKCNIIECIQICDSKGYNYAKCQNGTCFCYGYDYIVPLNNPSDSICQHYCCRNRCQNGYFYNLTHCLCKVC